MYYAVLTGDIIASSGIGAAQRKELVDTLKGAFTRIETVCGEKSIASPFEIFRGDSFQGVLRDIRLSLLSVLIIRITLLQWREKRSRYGRDARIAIGIGGIDYLSDRTNEGDGPAYRLSGHLLDKMKKNQQLAIETPWSTVNDELQVEFSLLNVIISSWTSAQAEAIWGLLNGRTQQQIANDLKITQGAVNHRLNGSGWPAVEKLLTRFKAIIKEVDRTI